MKQSIFLFNPDNDLALANGDENFVPPRQAGKMAEDLALLPVWYAKQSSHILIPSLNIDKSFSDGIAVLIPETHWVDNKEVNANNYSEVIPWGWNPMLVKQLGRLGIPERFLPSKEYIQQIRIHSHRSYSVLLLSNLLDSNYLCGSSLCLYTEEEVKCFVEKNNRCLLKAPWSSSGKGLFWCRGEYNYLIKQWSKRIIERQNCVVGEEVYVKVEDFALEFYSDGDANVLFAGYSLFYTDKHGAYKKNVLAADSYILDYLSKYVGAEILLGLCKKLEQLLSVTIGVFYKGYLGVDMMICRFPDKPYFRVHPCVEVNLRMNMGMVSRLIYDRFISPDVKGYFSIDYFSRDVDLRKSHEEALADNPLVLRDGKVYSGYLSLTPVYENTHYRACFWIK